LVSTTAKSSRIQNEVFFVTTIYVWEVKRIAQEEENDVCLKQNGVYITANTCKNFLEVLKRKI